MGDGSAEVVSIGVRGPGYSRLACAQVAAARRKLGLDYGGFARLMTEMLGWEVPAAIVAAWEDDSTPPGDVLLACITAAREAPGALAMSLLAAVPPAFPAEAIAGPWVTCYQFSHDGHLLHHADIAQVTAEPGGRIRAANHPPEPRSEGRVTPFRNEIDAGLAGRHLIGEWQNTSDTRYYGTVQLAVLPGETVMQGYYAGVDSDVAVSSATWKWVRLDPGQESLAEITLRDPAELYGIVMRHSQLDAPLTLADVRGEP